MQHAFTSWLMRPMTAGPALCWLPTSLLVFHPRRRRFHRPAPRKAPESEEEAKGPSVAATQTVFSGIQPTGIPHLGNYLGALRTWVSLQHSLPNDASLIFSIVDLHAITLHHPAWQIQEWKRQTLAILLAIGLDPERCTIFYQSSVPAHVELMWVLSCNASLGMLNRMTQWKDKSKLEDSVKEATSVPALKLGIFTYPVLQAADILVHSATHVPVGEDQVQHLELTRNLAVSFNHHFGPTFPIPQTSLSPAKRIMSLRDPTTKMSKSAPNPKSRVLLTDSPEVIQSKMASAVTDSLPGISYEPTTRPGVSNLIEIYAHMINREDFDKVAEEFNRAGLSMRDLKEKVAAAVAEGLAGIRRGYQKIVEEKAYLDSIAKKGMDRAEESAQSTMQRVRKALGLI